MPNAKAYSPITTITAIDGSNNITVNNIGAFPTVASGEVGLAVVTKASNIGYRDNDPGAYETISYGEIDGSILKQVTRQVEGAAELTLAADDYIAAFWTAEAYTRLKTNISSHKLQDTPHQDANGTHTWGFRVNVDKSVTMLFEEV